MTRSILQIDADPTVGQLISSILSPKGYEIEQVASGLTALEKLKERKYDICIVGDQLADLDGIGFLIQLRKGSGKLKVILVTKTWPSSDLYERLTKDLKVDLVAIRPIKASIFGAQVDSLVETEQEPKKIALSVEELHFEAIQALRSKYIIVLPERIKKLSEAFDAARHEHKEPRYLEEAIRLSHNLKGTAGSCGLIELSEASGHLEGALKAIMASGLFDNETSWDEVQNFFDYVVQVANVIASSKESEAMDVSSKLRSMAPTEPSIARVLGAEGSTSTPVNPAIMPFSLEGFGAPLGQVISGKPLVSHREPDDIDLDKRMTPSTVPNFNGTQTTEIGRRLLPLSEDPTSIRVLIMAPEQLPEIDRKANGLPVQFIATNNIEDALVTARTLALDAVLIDIDTGSPAPGITLARNIRGLPGNESLPVAFVSTSMKPSNPVDSAHAGASLYLEKPVVQQMLTNAVDYLLSVRTGGRPRILIIDDDEDFVKLVGAILGKEGMIVKGLCAPDNVVEAVGNFAPDIVLLDVMMPGVSGYQICHQMREQPQWQDLPVLFLTAQTGLSARLAAFEAGGDDYLPKPVAPAELLMRVKVRLERARMLRERADKDVLTGLMIRRAFMEQLQALISESLNNQLRFSLCLLDVDHFKKVNDTYGHLAGDRVLTHLGALIRKRFRVEDLRGRWGGEEFIVAFRHIEKETAQGALERCMEELKSHVFEGDSQDQTFSVSFSAGLVSFPEDGTAPQTLIKYADECLYEAKRQGRGRVIARPTDSESSKLVSR